MKGQLVELKPLQRGHIKQIVEWRNDPEVAYWATGSDPIWEFTTEEEADKSFSWHLEHSSRYDTCEFAVYTLEGVFIGFADYRDVDRVKRSCSIGITIGNRNYWGEGYGTEAIRLLVKYLFERLNLRRIQLDTWSGNERALKAYSKCGFKTEGTLRENEFVRGKYYDTIIMGLLRNELTLQPGKGAESND